MPLDLDTDLFKRTLALQKELSSVTHKLQRSEEELLTLRIMNKKCLEEKDQEDSYLEHRLEQELSHYKAIATQAEADSACRREQLAQLQTENVRSREECRAMAKEIDCLKVDLERARLERLAAEERFVGQIGMLEGELKKTKQEFFEEQRAVSV